jgi:hypothetical protein
MLAYLFAGSDYYKHATTYVTVITHRDLLAALVGSVQGLA